MVILHISNDDAYEECTTRVDPYGVHAIIYHGNVSNRFVKAMEIKFECPKLGILGLGEPQDMFLNTDVEILGKYPIELNGILIAGLEVINYIEDNYNVDIFVAENLDSVQLLNGKLDTRFFVHGRSSKNYACWKDQIRVIGVSSFFFNWYGKRIKPSELEL